MEPYTSSSGGGPLNVGLGPLQSTHSTLSSHSAAPAVGPQERGGPSGGPLSYGIPSYPTGGPSGAPGGTGGLLPPYSGTSADTPMHASIGIKDNREINNYLYRGGVRTAKDNAGTSSSSSSSSSSFVIGGGSLSTPPLSVVTPETLESPNGGCGSLEEFDCMVSDLRRTFVSWLRHTEAELKRERNDLVRRKREFEEEKKKVWALFQQDKEAEYNKIKEERRAAHAELQQQLKQLEIERNDARGKLQKEKQKFIQEQENARRKQVLERERFRQEVLAFESLNQRVMDATIAAEMVIDINVGGVIYESSRETLIQQKKSLLSSILSGKFPVPRDKQGRIFFDRDAELFRIILNFLRQPNTPPQPRDSAESDALCAEAAFYGLNFFSSPLVFALGGNDGKKHLDTIEYYNYKQQRWIYCPPMQTERAYASAAAIHNKIYLCGGQNINYKALCDVEVYDALLGSWFSCQPLSIPRRNACASSLNKRVFIIGGFNGESILSSVEGLDTRMKNWIHLAPLNSPRSSAMCCAHGDSLVVLGGTTGERLRTVEVYDERMDKWETLPASMIEVRSAGSAVSGNNHLYVLGGIDSEHRIINSIEGLDPDGKQWSFLNPMPNPRMDCSAVFAEGAIMVTGGQDGEVLNSVCFYDPEGDQWSTGPPMLSPRYGHCLVVTNL